MVKKDFLSLFGLNCASAMVNTLGTLSPANQGEDPRFLCAQMLLYLGRKQEAFSYLDKVEADPVAKAKYADVVFESSDAIGNCFVFNGVKYRYFVGMYNHTWQNERIVEIPVAVEFLRQNRGSAILEIGNVMSHYYTCTHDVVDKYEQGDGVINADILSYTPGKKYDAILSLSTLEHIGKDKVKDDGKVLQVYSHIVNKLLSDTGVFLFSVPIGFNPVFDGYIDRGDIKPHASVCLQRISADNDWIETAWENARSSRYMDPYHCANGLYFGFAFGVNHPMRTGRSPGVSVSTTQPVQPAYPTPQKPPATVPGAGPSKGRLESNRWLRNAAAGVTGKVLSIGSRDDRDGEGKTYRAYFTLAASYTTSDVSGPVDLVLDARDMTSIPTACFNAVFCSGVLEHVDDFRMALSEITRILAPGGTLLLGLPFKQAIHDEPLDFWRFTRYAIEYLLKDRYTIVEIKEIGAEDEKFPVAYWVKALKKQRG